MEQRMLDYLEVRCEKWNGPGPCFKDVILFAFGVQRTELEPEVESKGSGEGHREAILSSK